LQKKERVDDIVKKSFLAVKSYRRGKQIGQKEMLEIASSCISPYREYLIFLKSPNSNQDALTFKFLICTEEIT
jgi:hypothetical protein